MTSRFWGAASSVMSLMVATTPVTWVRQATLTAPVRTANDFYGSGLEVAGDRLLVAAYGNTPKTYVYGRQVAGGVTTWPLVQTIGKSAGSGFGVRLGLSGNTLTVGREGSTVTVNGAALVPPELDASNGIVHPMAAVPAVQS